MIINDKNYGNNPNNPINKKQQYNKYPEKELYGKLALIKKDGVYISQNYPSKSKKKVEMLKQQHNSQQKQQNQQYPQLQIKLMQYKDKRMYRLVAAN